MVDDDPDIRRVIRHHLSNAGYTVLEAEQGRQAMEHLQHTLPDLILLDLMMPVMNGFETLEAIRADDRLNNIPVVVLSAMDLSEAEQLSLEESVSRVMRKTEEFKDVLLTEVARLMPNHHKPPGHVSAPQAVTNNSPFEKQ